MTFFLRKSFRLGPLRLNLSKRGLGASVGVKGARVGVDAQGKEYVAGGRFGLYYRERLRGRPSMVAWIIIVVAMVGVLWLWGW